MEDPTQEVHKHIHEEAEKSGEKGITRIALTAALIAVLAATASLFSEHQNNEAMLDQLKASDSWGYYQAKGIKSSILETRIELLKSLGKPHDASWDEKLESYKTEQDEISKTAKEFESASKKHLQAHNRFSYAVTLLQVAIGLSAISALTRRRWLWLTSVSVAGLGLVLLIWGLSLTWLI